MPSTKSSNKPKTPSQAPQSTAPAAEPDAPRHGTPSHEWSFTAIGTEWWIGVYEQLEPLKLARKLGRVQRRIAARIEAFDKHYSRFRPDSLITRISNKAGTYELPPDGVPLFAFYRKLYDLTGGSVTPLIGQVLADAGYDAHYSFQSRPLRQPPQWDDVLTIRGRMLTAAQPIVLDVGAAGKGYLVDIICNLLAGEGISKYCVDAGGDMRIHGLSGPLRIGLENPRNTGEVIGVASIQEGALCGSAGTRRAWGEFHHIMDPKTLRPASGTAAVWVAAPTALVADGLATALFFTPAATLQKHFDFAYCEVYDDNTMQYSTHFPAEFFTEG
ncbi:MAG TPA: FAD:protein FMN transferase [Candidatus Saccharimonadales bacterium]|nr:FAD:protein FMN transferase [Candidatus Saccharimonadales bacterium]